MPRSFRQSRFRNRETIGEDVNPSAYIVNLADCMLVLACGFMVAMISFWNIDVSPTMEEISEEEQLEEIDPETLPENLESGGSFYEEAGVVYRDPATGQLYLVSGEDSDTNSSGTDEKDETHANSDKESGNSGPTTDMPEQRSSASDENVRNARANGAD